MTSVFIPGRLASGRLPNKLILPINQNGDTLWDLACAKLEALIAPLNRYALCSDPELIDIASKYNIEVIERTPASTKIDEPLIDVFADVNQMQDLYLMFLNPCLSKLKISTIDNAIRWFDKSPFEYATSVKEYRNWTFNEAGESITPIDYSTLSTKSIPKMYQCAHCFHLFDRDQFLNDGLMLKAGHGIFEVSHEETIDVDTTLDLKVLRAINGSICD
ncbi:hypothetical protein [Bacteroides sp.]|uniref:hypothetical protein n=1 Tax=Bacteroides sp. TaxID=29523 RepID=UPI002639DB78|nr:hypothetical protein [Bacteroides sp.]MDD3039593.1 hypothetical protein [Bacteroides sp.]